MLDSLPASIRIKAFVLHTYRLTYVLERILFLGMPKMGIVADDRMTGQEKIGSCLRTGDLSYFGLGKD